MKLNIGCGLDYKEGYHNIDFNPIVKADQYIDISNGLPFEENSIEEIFCSHTLEHLDHPEFLLKEIQRVLKDDGTATIVLPHYNCLLHHRDLTHKVFATSKTFDQDVQNANYQTNFEIKKIGFTAPRPLKWFGLKFLENIGFPVYDVWFTLKKRVE